MYRRNVSSKLEKVLFMRLSRDDDDGDDDDDDDEDDNDYITLVST